MNSILTKEYVEKNFKIQKQIGQGSTAVVYQAIDSLTNNKYAIKVFTNKLKTPKSKDIFQIESELMTGLDNDNICKLQSTIRGLFLTKRDELIIGDSLILELSNKGCLGDAIRKNSLSIKEKISVVQQLIQSVAYLHQIGMAHNDIKVDNITLNNNNQVKVIDFSSSTKINFMEGEQIGQLGTKGYMAPELINATNNFEEIDRQKCDIFSLGVVILMIFMGKCPFMNVNEFDYSYKEVISQNFEKFWEKQAEKMESTIQSEDFNYEGFKQLINSMICFDPKQRKPLSTLSFSSFFTLIEH